MSDPSIPDVLAPGPGGQGVAQHRDYLYRYALLHLRDASRAEDVVQETLLAAMENQERFSGRSSLRTWLTGILEHKIIDVFRRQSREAPLDSITATNCWVMLYRARMSLRQCLELRWFSAR